MWRPERASDHRRGTPLRSRGPSPPARVGFAEDSPRLQLIAPVLEARRWYTRLMRFFSHLGKRTAAISAVVLMVAAMALIVPTAMAHDGPGGQGASPGRIKHVWLVILENKSYDATFTGLNQNTYLWKTLPQQGALLKNYYGTGHFSLDNYTSMVSGQGPNPDGQDDCPEYKDAVGSVISQHASPNVGQWASAAGPNGARRDQRLRLPRRRPHAVQPARRRARPLEGLPAGPAEHAGSRGLHLWCAGQPGRCRGRRPGERHRG